MSGSTRTSDNNSSAYVRGTKVMQCVVPLEIAAADVISGGDVVPICELPPEAIVTSIKVINDTLDSGTDALFDIGIYKTTKLSVGVQDNADNDASEIVDESAFEVLDVDIYVDGTAELQTANDAVTPVEILASGTNAVDVDSIYKTVRVLGGITIGEDPAKYFLGLKAAVATVAGAAAGGVTFLVSWIQG